jgi:hypothetical protein
MKPVLFAVLVVFAFRDLRAQTPVRQPSQWRLRMAVFLVRLDRN